MNTALIFAGGSGTRMNTKSRPKQFLELNGKPIIIYTIELFENHPDIDNIVVVCIEGWISYLEKMLQKFDITKVVKIVAGGTTGQESIYKGLLEVEKYATEMGNPNPIVLIHDGVRPLINKDTISDNIDMVKAKGNCITCSPATETFVVEHVDNQGKSFYDIPDRNKSFIAKAPQSFFMRDILAAHRQAIADNLTNFVDSCSIMTRYGHEINTIIGPSENIKITTPTDFFVLRAIVEVRENQQIFGF